MITLEILISLRGVLCVFPVSCVDVQTGISTEELPTQDKWQNVVVVYGGVRRHLYIGYDGGHKQNKRKGGRAVTEAIPSVKLYILGLYVILRLHLKPFVIKRI